MRRYLSPSDIAASLGISRRAVYRMLQDLPRVRLGRSIRVAEDDLMAYLAKHTQRPDAELRDPQDPPKPSWLRPLKPRNVKR